MIDPKSTQAQDGAGCFGLHDLSKLILNDTPYHQRGWCVAEMQWLCTRTSVAGFAPMTPARFRKRVELGKQEKPEGLPLKFTHRSLVLLICCFNLPFLGAFFENIFEFSKGS